MTVKCSLQYFQQKHPASLCISSQASPDSIILQLCSGLNKGKHKHRMIFTNDFPLKGIAMEKTLFHKAKTNKQTKRNHEAQSVYQYRES